MSCNHNLANKCLITTILTSDVKMLFQIPFTNSFCRWHMKWVLGETSKFTRTAQLNILQIKIKQEICTRKNSGGGEWN